MDQVDRIIISSLSAIGCEVEDEVELLSQFGMEEVVEGVVRCLKTISAETHAALSHKLPHNIAQRFRAAAAIADAVKALGYTGDLGYQSLLYPNEVDIRRLFSFLLERLPKEDTSVLREDLSPSGVLLARARQQLRHTLSRPWLPPHCRRALLKRRINSLDQPGSVLLPLGDTLHLQPYTASVDLPLGYPCQGDKAVQSGPARCIKRLLKSSAGDAQGAALLCCVLASHGRLLQGEVVSPRRPDAEGAALEPLLQVPSPSTDSLVTPLSPLSPMANLSLDEPLPQQQQQQQSVAELRARVAELEEAERQRLQLIERAALDNEELAKELMAVRESEREVRESLESAETSLSLLSSYEESRTKLEGVITSAPARAARLTEQFEAHCAPIRQQIQRVKSLVTCTLEEQESLASEIERLRNERQAFLQEIPTIETQADALAVKLQARGQAVSRSVYTKQILEITAKVQKQRQVTEEVLSNVKKLQKEINSLAGKIDRSFAVVEELSYQASWSSGCAGLYRSVVAIHDTGNEIVDVTREAGAIQRKTADLRELVLQEERKGVAAALTRLQEDLAAVKQENEHLANRIATAPH